MLSGACTELGEVSKHATLLLMKVVARNQRARFDFDIGETIEAGIILTGQEVKSARAGHINLSGAYVSFFGGKAILKKAKIQQYTYASQLLGYDPERGRELLLKKSERDRLMSKAEEGGMTVFPLEVHAGKTVKVLLAVGKGRKKADKRQRIKEREIDRSLREKGDY